MKKARMLKSFRSLMRFRKRKRTRHQHYRLSIFHHDTLIHCEVKKPLVVVLTGAGVSAESGINTFRAEDGLWEEHRLEDVATLAGYQRDPKLVQDFYNQRRHQLQQPNIQPNLAHFILAELEEKLGDHFLLITQNIDDLHEKAGNKRIIHMHGELLKVRCVRSGKVYSWQENLNINDRCSCCEPPQPLRPHIVWFGEMPLEMDAIYDALAQADYFVAIGTSGNVYPAAGFVEVANQNGAHTVELNLEPSLVESKFAEKRYGLATEVVPEYIATLFGDAIGCCSKNRQLF